MPLGKFLNQYATPDEAIAAYLASDRSVQPFARGGLRSIPSIDIPSIELPSVELPSVEIPGFEPSITGPELAITGPEMPTVDIGRPVLGLPEIPTPEMPSFDIGRPTIEMPPLDLTIPQVDFPQVEFPQVDIPLGIDAISLPSLDLPELELGDLDLGDYTEVVKEALPGISLQNGEVVFNPSAEQTVSIGKALADVAAGSSVDLVSGLGSALSTALGGVSSVLGTALPIIGAASLASNVLEYLGSKLGMEYLQPSKWNLFPEDSFFNPVKTEENYQNMAQEYTQLAGDRSAYYDAFREANPGWEDYSDDEIANAMIYPSYGMPAISYGWAGSGKWTPDQENWYQIDLGFYDKFKQYL